MAKPAIFSGAMEEMEAFMNSCIMYISRILSDFPTEQVAIMWVLSYMQKGSALEWRDNILEGTDQGSLKFKTLDDLMVAIKEKFGDPNKWSTKIYKLQTILRADRTADEHVQSFRKAARGSGYKEYALIEEFKRSLNSGL
jgi:hypothetical protein